MKVNFNASWLLGLGMLLLSSCGGSSTEDITEKFEAVPVIVEKGDNWSLVDRDGKFLYQDEFENQPTAVMEGHFAVREGDNYVLYKATDKKPTAVKGCEELVSVGMMSDGLIPVTKKDSRISVINKSGEQVFEITPVNKHEIVESDIWFCDDMLAIRDDEGNWGFVNRKGEVAIKPQYLSVGQFDDGLAVVSKSGEEKTYEVIDKKGETVFKFKKGWEPVNMHFESGVLVVNDNNDRYLLVDKKGESTKCPAKVKSIGDINKDYIVFGEDGNYGVMKRKDMEIVIRAKYNRITIMPDNKFLCLGSKGEADILNAEGEKELSIDDFEYGVAYTTFFGLMGREKSDIVILDKEGKPVKGMEYFNIGSGTITLTVQTDYFDLARISDIIVMVANPKGIGKFQYGKEPQSMLTGEARDYRYTSSVEIPEETGTGYKFNYKTTAKFSKYIADYTYSYGYGSTYYFVHDNPLKELNLRINIDKKIDENAFNQFIEALKNAGFTLGASEYKDNEGVALLRKGNELVIYLEQEQSYGDRTTVSLSTTNEFTDEQYNLVVKKIKNEPLTEVEENTEVLEEVAAEGPYAY